MNTRLLVRVRQHFNSDLVSREQNRDNMRKWVQSVRRLGDRWDVNKFVPKLPPEQTDVPEFLKEKP